MFSFRIFDTSRRLYHEKSEQIVYTIFHALLNIEEQNGGLHGMNDVINIYDDIEWCG